MILLLTLLSAHAAPPREVAARDGANVQRPSWSADGALLAYEANFHDKKRIELYTGDPRTGAFGRVQPTVRSASAMTAGFATSGTTGGQVAHELSWAPAAIGRFVYATSGADLDYDLAIGGGGALAPHPGADGGAAWSPDGRWIAFTSARTGQGDLYLLDVQAVEAPPKRLTTDATSAELFAAWSPDSEKLAYVGHTQQGDNLWLLDGLRGAPSRLTDWSGSQVRPTFSPNGRQIAFYANHDAEDRFDLWVMEVGGAKPVKLIDDVVLDGRGPSWADDERLIVVQDDDVRFDPIVVVAVAKPGEAKRLDLGTVGHGDLDVTRGPDGKTWLAYVAQGRATDEKRAFDKLYVTEID